jgi:hypothetical protein
MGYEKTRDGSYVCNCFISKRSGEMSEQLFTLTEKSITATLNGYAIVPIEDYARLVELARPQNAKLRPIKFSKEKIDIADKELC